MQTANEGVLANRDAERGSCYHERSPLSRILPLLSSVEELGLSVNGRQPLYHKTSQPLLSSTWTQQSVVSQDMHTARGVINDTRFDVIPYRSTGHIDA
jgi:hypothetical protein